MTRSLASFGLLTAGDAAAIGAALDDVAGRFERPTVIEIGVREGQTARGIHAFFGSRPIDYWGVDNNRDLPVHPPFPSASLVIGESTEVLDRLPTHFHFVLVDGCHCLNHVVLDFLLYGRRLVPGGLLAMHDAAPSMQGKDYQGHGPQTEDFHVATLRGLEMLRPEDRGWDLVTQTGDEGWGGTRIYRKR